MAMKKRTKNIEPGFDPESDEDNRLDTVVGIEPPKSKHQAPVGELEFNCCDNNFIDCDDFTGETVRDEALFPSAGAVAFGASGQVQNPRVDYLPTSTVNFERVIGDDDRVRILDTLDADRPWAKRICSLIATTRTGERLRGTGWLAGKRLVMTTAHNLFVHERAGWVKTVTVIPGRNGRSAPFETFTVRAPELLITRGWEDRKDLTADFGGIIIPKSYSQRHLGQTGFFSIRVFSDNDLVRARVKIAGYPAFISPVGTQWWHGRRISPRISPDALRYNIDTTKGQSGSPAFITIGGQRYVAGIHNVDIGAFNQAVRINSEVLSVIRDWKRRSEQV